MKKFNVNKEAVGEVAKTVLGVAVFVGMMVLPSLSGRDTRKFTSYDGFVTYGDVIAEVMNSGMLGSDKQKIVALVPKNSTMSIYRAVIEVVNSGMLGSDKVKAIQSICEQ